jgi:hypothetical protein
MVLVITDNTVTFDCLQGGVGDRYDTRRSVFLYPSCRVMASPPTARRLDQSTKAGSS